MAASLDEKHKRAQERTALRELLDNTANNYNQALSSIEQFFAAKNEQYLPHIYHHVKVDTTKKGELIIRDVTTLQKVEVEDCVKMTEFLQDDLLLCNKLFEDQDRLQQLETQIIAAIGQTNFEWYVSKINPDWL